MHGLIAISVSTGHKPLWATHLWPIYSEGFFLSSILILWIRFWRSGGLLGMVTG